ncbi:MAG: hypothetical protein QHG98_03795 [Methanothrix sp.]|jgi:hypothetical protein|nr:hypothetical protein [Methanothrix sp.]
MQGEEVACGSLTLLGQDTGNSRVELQHRVSLREGGLAIGLLWDVLADSVSGECIACVDDLLIPLPGDMAPRLRKLLGKKIVLARLEGYRLAPYRPMRVPGWWG